MLTILFAFLKDEEASIAIAKAVTTMIGEVDLHHAKTIVGRSRRKRTSLDGHLMLNGGVSWDV